MIIILISIFICQRYYIEPVIQKRYLESDIYDFENNAWKYSIITFFLISIFTFAVERFIIIDDDKGKIEFYYILLYAGMMTFFLKNLTNDITLYINTKTHKDIISKNYTLKKNDSNKVFHLYDNKEEFIIDKNELDFIDSISTRDNLKSIYELKNNDVIPINFNKGFLDIKYLE